MADIIFNIAKGRVAELYNRVDQGDPADAGLVLVVLAATGLESDAVLEDKDTLADVLSGATNEVTNSGYDRIILLTADLAALAPDDTNDRMDLDLADQIFAAIAAGDGWGKLLICYDPDATSTSADANIIPLCAYDFVVTPDGNDIQAVVNAAGFFRAT